MKFNLSLLFVYATKWWKQKHGKAEKNQITIYNTLKLDKRIFMRSFGVHMYLFAIPLLSSHLNNNYKVCLNVIHLQL